MNVEIDILKQKKLLSDGITFKSIVDSNVKDIETSKDVEEDILAAWEKEWKIELKTLLQSEKEVLQLQVKEREVYFKEEGAKERSHKKAVKALGYWDLAKFNLDGKFEKDLSNLPEHLQEDYVDGSLSDINIEQHLHQ